MPPEADTATGTTTTEATTAAQTADQQQVATTATGDAANGSQAATQTAPVVEKVEDLPVWAQKIITDTRAEAASHRTKATTLEQQKQAILVAAGIKADEADPVEVAKTSKAEAAAARRELAVFKSAAAIGADPTKLLDRASFLTSINGIDPSDGAALKTAIEAAVNADSTLKAARAAGASAIDTPAGSGEVGQITEAQLAQMTPEQISEAYDKGLLKNLLS
ncbi:hypothetical protein [Subtercola endophyticus]|uniref:hypothetical protein n=1 Tax=Subtercola endophyticus TaxID=2895559 RepID=UPI001E2FA00C|nr:hypothetical protein [Subtercola endophyticus]UFS59480.1 hypothetical protein LQ955_01375 [Subtercola endophyticus]